MTNKQLSEIKSKLREQYKISPFSNIPFSVRDFRNYVLSSHARIEGNLNILLVKDLGNPFSKTTQPDQRQQIVNNAFKILENIEFSKKVTLLRDKKAIGRPLCEKIDEINKIRNKLAHPASLDISDFKSKQSQEKILAYLFNVCSELDQVLIKEITEDKDFDQSITSSSPASLNSGSLQI